MYELAVKSFSSELYYGQFTVIHSNLGTNLINKLNYIKLKFQENSNFFNSHIFGEKPIYLYRVFLGAIGNDVFYVSNDLVNSGKKTDKIALLHMVFLKKNQYGIAIARSNLFFVLGQSK